MQESADSIELPSGKGAGDENFPVGSILIARKLRPHIHAFYRYARVADDIADHPRLAAEEKIRRLDGMEAVLKREAPDSLSPSAARMRESLRETGIADRHCRELLIAFRQDATKRRYADWGELMTYCRYSASPVGRQVLDLHGESQSTWPANDALCTALQVINHLQDCKTDFTAIDRVYVPEEELRAAGASVEDLAAGSANPALASVLKGLAERMAAELMPEARQLPGQVRDVWLRVETAVIAALADRLVGRLIREDPVATRVVLGPFGLAAAVFKGIGRGLFPNSGAT